MGSIVAPVIAALIGSGVTAVIALYKLRPERDNTIANTAHVLADTLEQASRELHNTRTQLVDALARIDELTEVVDAYRDRLAEHEGRWGPDLITGS